MFSNLDINVLIDSLVQLAKYKYEKKIVYKWNHLKEKKARGEGNSGFWSILMTPVVFAQKFWWLTIDSIHCSLGKSVKYEIKRFELLSRLH